MSNIDNNKEEAKIRQLVDEHIQATRKKDIAGASAHYSDDVLIFDVVGPLQQKGSDSIQGRLKEWFASFKNDIGYEVAELAITTNADLAFCHSLNHVTAETNDGNKLDMWWRETLTWAQNKGQWQITHAHSSVPFDGNTGNASVGLNLD
jgi:uncharacterized protein (TIGR02246 family)